MILVNKYKSLKLLRRKWKFLTIEQVKKLKAMVVEVELIKNEEAFSEKDIKEIAEGQEKIIKKQDELIDYMLSLLQCWWMWGDTRWVYGIHAHIAKSIMTLIKDIFANIR